MNPSFPLFLESYVALWNGTFYKALFLLCPHQKGTNWLVWCINMNFRYENMCKFSKYTRYTLFFLLLEDVRWSVFKRPNQYVLLPFLQDCGEEWDFKIWNSYMTPWKKWGRRFLLGCHYFRVKCMGTAHRN